MSLDNLESIVNDVVGNMTIKEKRLIRFTKKESLIKFLHSFGRVIRNKYKLWEKPELVSEIGEDHADDASMIIIERVWDKLHEEKDLLTGVDKCSNYRTVCRDTSMPLPHPVVCEECGLPYYKAHASGDLVHPFKTNNRWVGIDE